MVIEILYKGRVVKRLKVVEANMTDFDFAFVFESKMDNLPDNVKMRDDGRTYVEKSKNRVKPQPKRFTI